MEIKKSSFLWKITYGWRGEEGREVKTTNLCTFFWRVVFFLLLVMPTALLFSIMVCVSAFFASRPAFFWRSACDWERDDMWVPYRKWFTIKGHRVYPIVVLLISAVALSIVHLGMRYPEDLKELIHITGIFMGFVVLAIMLLVIVWFIASGFKRFRKSDAYRLVGEYLRAKKEKVCPIIIFVE